MARKSSSERIAQLEERKKQLEAKLADLNARERAAERKRNTRRKIIVGGAMLAHTIQDAAFAATLREILDEAVQRPAERAAIADLLPPITSSP